MYEADVMFIEDHLKSTSKVEQVSSVVQVTNIKIACDTRKLCRASMKANDTKK
jgi:hypothetical protein